jgi:hypothetical protein
MGQENFTPEVESSQQVKHPKVTSGHSAEHLLDTILTVFILQIAILILLSFFTETGLQFTTRIFYQQETPAGYQYYAVPIKFQFDFSGYYGAAVAWRHGQNPYSFIFAAPSSLLIILPFSYLPFGFARVLYFLVNISLFLYSLSRFSKQIGLSPAEVTRLQLITMLYYPFVFLADRGNIDGFVVSFALLAFCSSRQVVKALLWGASAAAKLYSGLMILVFLRARQRKFALLTLAIFILLQLPFLKNEIGFVFALLGRGGYVRPFGNTSPYVLFDLFATGATGKILFFLFWSATLGYRLWHDRYSQDPIFWVDYIPWMISVPLVVFPYESVFLLPLLAVFAKRFDKEDLSGVEGLFIPGFLLTGFHPAAFASLFGLTVVGKGVLDLTNVVGLTLIIVAIAFASRPKFRPEAEQVMAA